MAYDEVEKLKKELEKTRSQMHIFYQITKAMRTTLRLEEIIYTILTGLTAHEGLGFNRAALFLLDEKEKNIKGFMGIGPMDIEETKAIWKHIEEEKKDLYDLIKNYHFIKETKVKPKFMEFIQSLTFHLRPESGFIFESVYKKGTLETNGKLKSQDPVVKRLRLEEFLAYPIWLNSKPWGVIIVDNYVTKKTISEEDVKFFTMFMEQARGAIENSKSFETTLTKSHTDSLTSLWNYGYFQYRLDEEMARAQSSKKNLSVMMIDLDDFKRFNDAQGHIQGDTALKYISRILSGNCRKEDILCRYGGEEFSLILPENSKEEAAFLGERMRQSVESKDILNYRFTISIGIATFPLDAREKTSLLRKADAALYSAKNNGKNRVVITA